MSKPTKVKGALLRTSFKVRYAKHIALVFRKESRSFYFKKEDGR